MPVRMRGDELLLMLLMDELFGPEEDPNGTHAHECPRDGTVWEHKNSNAGNVDAHRCPRCGGEQWARR